MRRIRRIALIAALITLIPAAFSYAETMAEPSNSSLGIRSVEWLRDHGAAGLVSKVESAYYSLTAPSKGGATLRALPQVGYGAAERAQAQRLKAQPLRAVGDPLPEDLFLLAAAEDLEALGAGKM